VKVGRGDTFYIKTMLSFYIKRDAFEKSRGECMVIKEIGLEV